MTQKYKKHMNLESNHFLLHALYDEYIGDGIGNNEFETYESFMKYFYLQSINKIYNKNSKTH